MRIFRVVVAGGSIAVLHEKQVVLLDGSLAAKRTLPLAAATRPIDVALSPDGDRVASCFESGVSLEGRSFTDDERWTNGSAITWARDAIWALREPGGEIFVLDPKTLTVRAKGALDWGDEVCFIIGGDDTERLIETHDVHDLELVLQGLLDRKVWVLADIGNPTVPFA